MHADANLMELLNGREMPKMSCASLVASFGDRMVLKGISMAIPKGLVTAIVGPSGCGKSTFIRCLNRMHETVPGADRSGEVWLDDQNIYAADVDPVSIRRRVGMVFQKANPFPSMSIRENVLSGFSLVGRKPAQSEEIVEKCLRRTALWDEVRDRLGSPGVSLSGGQQQRLCIARALAVEPEVLLLDEPCSALDPIATARIEDLLGSLRDNYTIVIVTHSMQQARRISDRAAFFLNGDLIEFENTDRLFSSPADSRTADFLAGRFG